LPCFANKLALLWVNSKYLKLRLQILALLRRKDQPILIEGDFMLQLMTVLLEYIDFSAIYNFISKDLYRGSKILPIMMPALCSILSGTYYAQNYASIIGGSLYISGKRLTPVLSSFITESALMRQHFNLLILVKIE